MEEGDELDEGEEGGVLGFGEDERREERGGNVVDEEGEEEEGDSSPLMASK